MRLGISQRRDTAVLLRAETRTTTFQRTARRILALKNSLFNQSVRRSAQPSAFDMIEL
jgi:hypothetical protein